MDHHRVVDRLEHHFVLAGFVGAGSGLKLNGSHAQRSLNYLRRALLLLAWCSPLSTSKHPRFRLLSSVARADRVAVHGDRSGVPALGRDDRLLLRVRLRVVDLLRQPDHEALGAGVERYFRTMPRAAADGLAAILVSWTQRSHSMTRNI